MVPPHSCQPTVFTQTPTIIPPVDLNGCLLDIHKNSPDLAFQDLVKSFVNLCYLLLSSEEKIIEILLTDHKVGHESGGSLFHDSHFIYCFKNEMFSQCVKGEWWTKDWKFKGTCLFSLVKFIRGGTDMDAFDFVAKTLKVDFSKKDVVQYQELAGHRHLSNPHRYPTVCFRNIPLQMLASPPVKFDFLNENGLIAFKLFEWKFNGEPILLFATVQVDTVTGRRTIEFIAPPLSPHMIFNRHLIDKNNNKEVHIHDEIARAYSSKTEQVIATWSGDLSISSQLDWDFLKGRNVSYRFDKYNLNSMRIGAQLIEKFSKMKPPLKLCTVSNPYKHPNYMIEVGQEDTSPDFNDNRKSQIEKLFSCMDEQGEMTIEQFYNFAKYYHGLDLKGQETNITPLKSGEGSEDKKNKPDYIVEPLFKRNQLGLIIAEPGVGKTWVAIDLAMMIACGGSIDPWLSAPNSDIILYVDSEIDDQDILGKKDLLMVNYTKKEN